jgi:diaminopimelate decarboxylase
MTEKKLPFTKEQLQEIIKQYPTPFHIYDDKAIRINVKRFIKAFSWNQGFKEYFAVKATPNPYILRYGLQFVGRTGHDAKMQNHR